MRRGRLRARPTDAARSALAAGALLGAVLAGALIGCGGGNAAQTLSVQSTPAPATTITKTQATTTATTPTQTSTSGGTTAPHGVDSPTNDLPPQPNSPQAKFERFCRKHPAACG